MAKFDILGPGEVCNGCKKLDFARMQCRKFTTKAYGKVSPTVLMTYTNDTGYISVIRPDRCIKAGEDGAGYEPKKKPKAAEGGE